MKPASLHEIKKELELQTPARLLELCMGMAKYKKDNKELLTYLLFRSEDIHIYITDVKLEMDEAFKLLPKHNVYIFTKSLRKVLRNTNKLIKHSGNKLAEAELLIYFCDKLKKSGIDVNKSTALSNLLEQQVKKITKAISYLHEDLQYDYLRELELI